MPPAVLASTLLDPLAPAFAQRALIAVLLLAVPAGLIGTWVVLRGLAFFTHAVGLGAYPAVIAAPLAGVAAPVGAATGALGFAALLAWLTRARARSIDPITGLILVAALAVGTLLAKIEPAGGGVPPAAESALVGSLLAIDRLDLWVSAAVSAIAALGAAVLGRRWLATGFDSEGGGGTRGDLALFALTALTVVATLPVFGALLSTTILVIPAATATLIADRLPRLIGWSIGLAALEGAVGTYLAFAFDVALGPAIATLAGAVFTLVALARGAGRRWARGARPIGALVLLVATLGLTACGRPQAEDQDQLTTIVATTAPVADIAREIAGDKVRIVTLVAGGADPHTFEPAPSDLRALAEARAILRSGGEIDAWVVDAAKASGGGRVPVDLSDAATLLETGAINAHWYLDLANVMAVSGLVRNELIKAYPAGRETFRAGARAYATRLAKLDAAISRCLTRLPHDRRRIVTDHDEFDYFAERYGLTIVARLAEASHGPRSRPSAASLHRLVGAATRRYGLRQIFVSAGGANRSAESVARYAGLDVVELPADTLAGRPGARSTTLVGAVAQIGDTFASKLSGGRIRCSLPANGA